MSKIISGGKLNLRCDLAADVAGELLVIARSRELDAAEVMRKVVLRAGELVKIARLDEAASRDDAASETLQ